MVGAPVAGKDSSAVPARLLSGHTSACSMVVVARRKLRFQNETKY